MVSRVRVSVATGRGVAERWRIQYERKDHWTSTVSGDSKDIYEALCKLGPNPDIAKVAEVIGNKSWSYISCSGCGDQVERAADFGSDYSDTNIQLCIECCRDGLGALSPSGV